MTPRKKPGGFRKEETVYALNFPDSSPLAGLRAEIKKLSAGQFTRLAALVAAITGAPDELDTEHVGSLARDVDELLRLIASGLRRWNWEDDDGPVPATIEGLMSRELEDVIMIASALMDCFAVAPPLPQGSDGTGKPSSSQRLTESQIPMSPSLPS